MTRTKSEDSYAGLAWGDHAACVCETAEERIELLSSYLHQGLERGEKVCCVTDRVIPGGLLDALSVRRKDLEASRASGRLSFIPMEELLERSETELNGIVEWLQAEERLALSQGYSALRVSMEMSWILRGKVRADELLAFELGLHSFLKNRKCLVLCQYERSKFKPSLLLYVLAVHPKIIRAKKVRDNCFFLASPHLFEKDPPSSILDRWLRITHEHGR
jgi:hypothetical protein